MITSLSQPHFGCLPLGLLNLVKFKKKKNLLRLKDGFLKNLKSQVFKILFQFFNFLNKVSSKNLRKFKITIFAIRSRDLE